MGTGKRIKEILKKQHKTIKQLSTESGVSANTLYSITKRDSIDVSFSVLEKVAAALEVDMYEIFSDEQRELYVHGEANAIIHTPVPSGYYNLSEEQQERLQVLYEKIGMLSENKRKILEELLDAMLENTADNAASEE